MNKLIIFDLDGVLIESRELHYEALNAALTRVDPQLIITREENL
jgi:beta-phosphoglucomutase-like phosphatase (HAD superfamily)